MRKTIVVVKTVLDKESRDTIRAAIVDGSRKTSVLFVSNPNFDISFHDIEVDEVDVKFKEVEPNLIAVSSDIEFPVFIEGTAENPVNTLKEAEKVVEELSPTGFEDMKPTAAEPKKSVGRPKGSKNKK